MNSRRFATDERGSLAPLTIGYLMLAVLAVFVCFCATDLYIAQKHLDQVADAAALAAADAFVVDGMSGSAQLTPAIAQTLAHEIVAVSGAAQTPTANAAHLVSAVAVDETATVVVSSTWHPPMLSGILPSVTLSAESSASTLLR